MDIVYVADTKAYIDNKFAESGWFQPSGTLSITKNGTHDITEYASVNVNVEGADDVEEYDGSYTITEDGGE